MTKLRQIWVPKLFRLPEPEFTKDQVDLLEDLVQLMAPTVSMLESSSKNDRENMAQFLIDLGTGIWRVRKKIESLGRLPEEIRAALYSLESTWKSMSESGVEIIDHDGTIPSEKEAIVVEVRQIPNLVREQVVETRTPTIMLHGEVIQVGEVVIGRPARAESQTVTFRPVEPEPAPSLEPEPEPEPSVDEFDPFAGEVQTFSAQVSVESVDPDDIGGSAFSTVTEAILGRPLEELAAEQAERAEHADEEIAEEESSEEAVKPEEPIEDAELSPEVEAVSPVETEDEAEDESDDDVVAAPTLDLSLEEVGESTSDGDESEAFVRDVPTPYDAALAAEEAAEEAAPPKRKRAPTKRGLAQSARLGKSEGEEDGDAKPKRRVRKKGADLDELTEELLNG